MIPTTRFTLAALASLAFAIPFTAFAEDVVTKTDGGKLKGKVLVDAPDVVKIKTAGGVITLPRDEVQSVQREKDVAEQLSTRIKEIEKAQTAAKWLELAGWCDEHDLWVAELDALKKVVKLDPDNEKAWVQLGYRQLKGKWVPEGEYYAAQGWSQVDGRWVSPQDKEKLDQGLVKWGGDEWVTKEEADRREKAAEAEAEHERQGVKTNPGAKPESAEPSTPTTPTAPKVVAKKGKEEKPRFFEGKLLYTKSRDQILKQLDAIANETIPPLAGRKGAEFDPLDDPAQAAAIKRLKAYRYLSDVPTDIELDTDEAVLCTAACKLLNIVGHLTHTPDKPAGCPDRLYKVGYEGTSHSNLAQASRGINAVQGVDMWMDDSDQSNIDRTGHRRWCLNVSMKKTAFGVMGQFAAMYSMDHGHEVLPYDAVLYPARGYFPANMLAHDAAWSAYLSNRFSQAKESEVKVTVTPVDQNMKKGPPLELDYYHIDGGGYGTGVSCIIFRPKGADRSPGSRYWVEIKGTKDSSGADSPLEYLVEFF